MRRVWAWIAAGAVAALLGCALSADERPNVVLIVIDTLRADRLGAYGFPDDTSPALDAIADRGVRFATVLAPSSWTRTSIGALVTSLHPRTLGIFHEYRDALDDRFVTLAEVLWASGYRTLGATANPNVNTAYRFHQGFDAYTDSDVVFPWMRASPGQRKTEHAPLPAGRDLYDALLRALGDEPARPFYVQVTVMEVHEHLAAKDPLPERYRGLFRGRRDEAYLRAVRWASDEAADFIAAVEALPGGRNTLFVVTSDHGEGLGDHPDVSNGHQHGFLLYASQLRVPLILYHPDGGLPAGRVVETPVRLLDVMPTVLDFAGLAGPEGMAGRSLLPLLRGEPLARQEAVFAETRFQRRNKVAAYTDAWTYVENREESTKLPPRGLHPAGVVENGALTDVSAEHPEVVERMAALVAEWERAHPPAEATTVADPQSVDELQQLRDLGYLR
ncbi:MAG: sulfatase [Myxococcota bacterium]|nr:sulfatase [Myxococcota bacterium]